MEESYQHPRKNHQKISIYLNIYFYNRIIVPLSSIRTIEACAKNYETKTGVCPFFKTKTKIYFTGTLGAAPAGAGCLKKAGSITVSKQARPIPCTQFWGTVSNPACG